MDVTITPGTAKVTVIAYAPTVKMRKAIYMLMYEVAKQHRDEAKKYDGKNENEEIQNSMICILFCYTCLEAFINTIGRDKLGDEWAKYDNKRANTERKWQSVSDNLATKKYGRPVSVFNKGQKPFKSFMELEAIREEYLVHNKAEYSDVVKTKYGDTEGTINTLNSQNADWACNTVKEMVNELVKNIDGAPSVDWVQ